MEQIIIFLTTVYKIIDFIVLLIVTIFFFIGGLAIKERLHLERPLEEWLNLDPVLKVGHLFLAWQLQPTRKWEID